MFEPLPHAIVRSAGDAGSEPVLVVDAATGAIVYVNAAAAAAFGLTPDRAIDTPVAAVLADLANLEERRFLTRVALGGVDRDADVSVAALAGAGGGAVLVTVRPLRAGTEDASAEKRSERLESLWTLVVRRGFAGDEQVRAILRESVRGVGLERATLARVVGAELAIEFADVEARVGERLPIATSFERRAVAGSGTFAVLDTALDPDFAEIAGDTRAFLSSAFRVGDERWVLTFASRRARTEPFGEDDWRYVDHVVEALSRGIERRAKDERIERLAYFDALTALPNRTALHARLDEALADAERSGGRAAVLFLDIDGFKSVNDTVGHRGGDAVLAEVAQRLRGTLRRDEYVGRLGGDEFAIVIPAVGERAEIESIAQRIGGVLSFPFAVEDYRFSLSASIGVALYPVDATGRDDLLSCADAAMYAAKEDGGSHVRFADLTGERDGATARSPLGGEPRDIGYLLCFQPILDIRAGRVAAAEALIRRIHPVHGLLAPERGWSIARDTAGRRSLDRWVLREAAAQARAWRRAGSPLRVDVNLAAFDLDDIDGLLADDELGGDARELRIEVNGSHFDGDRADRMNAFVAHCAASGIGLVLDGFAGGLGDVASLAHVPIEALKLERALVEGITVSRTTRAIVEGSIIVARSLGWSVIAKGVETAAQFDALVDLGCDAIQGFRVAHPMTAVDFEAWSRAREPLAERPA